MLLGISGNMLLDLFIHLKVHTAYSLCEGAIKVDDIPKACKERGMPAIAITDTNNMFGVLEFSIKCASNGVQPICGTTIDVQYKDVIAPLTLLAKTRRGYENLMKLMTCFYVERKGLERKFITIQDMLSHNVDVIALSGGATGPAGKLYLGDSEKSKEDAFKFIKDMHMVFSDNFYMEVSRHGMRSEMATENFFVDLAMSDNIPLVATNDVYFLEKGMSQAQEALMCINDSTYLTTKDRRKLTPEHYLKTSREMYDLFSDLKEAVENTALIAQRCSYMPVQSKPMLPRFDDGSGECEDDIILRVGYKGLEKRLEEEVYQYPKNKTQDKNEIKREYFERFDFEMKVIKDMGFCGYFLIVSDFVTWARNHEIPVGPGRGSGAGSLVGWSLRITDLDPIRYHLIFERFLNPDRVSMPDFDIDFCQSRRDEVIDYVQSRYGKANVAHIIALGKLQARVVLRDVGRVIQMPYGLCDKICKLVPNNPSHPVDLSQALEIEPQLKQMMEKDDSVSFLINVGLQLEGLYRHASIHAAGIVISHKAVDEVVPLYSDPETNLAITQFNMKYAEIAGLVKFDFLGLKTLTIIKETCNNIKKYKKIDLDISKINIEDKNTFNLLCNVDVVGVFQLESTGMKDVVEKLQPDNIEDIIALVSLYRPGPMDDIPKYLARKHGKEAIEYLHPLVEPILKNTYGVMVYQEQVMKIAQVIGGYTLAGADLLRRAMGKKIKEEMVRQRKIFIDGAKKHNIDESVATQLFAQMEKFAGYGFNRSHAAPYALLSYQTAFLKANYRKEFYIAVLNLDIDNTEKVSTYINDAKQAGIKIFLPDVNKSEGMFTEEEDGIRYAFCAIKGIGVRSMDYIVRERERNGQFKDIYDFLRRTNPLGLNKKQLEGLICSGALDSIHGNRRQLYESAERLLKLEEKSGPKQFSLFASELSDDKLVISDIPEWSDIEKLSYERSFLGFYLSSHPIEIYKEFISDFAITESSQFRDSIQQINIAVILLSKKEKLSKNAQKYVFATVSDPSGSFEVTIFPELYAQVASILKVGNAYIISANIKMESGNTKIMATSLNDINIMLSKQKVYITLSDGANIDRLYRTIESFEDGDNKISFIVKKSDTRKLEVETKYSKNLSISNRKKLLEIEGVSFFTPSSILQ